jgi:D-glycero-D-manno-heptose 1,7-bisphosphate phosphatase
MISNRAVFLDKDGTLVENIPYNVNPARICLIPGVDEALRRLYQAGFSLVIATNQSGVARGFFSEDALNDVENRLRELIREKAEAELLAFYYCPHHPEGVAPNYAVDCSCRKPKPGLMIKAADQFNISLQKSWFIGDILDDIEAGNRAGCWTILIDNGNETIWKRSSEREPDYIVKGMVEAAEVILSANNGLKDRK